MATALDVAREREIPKSPSFTSPLDVRKMFAAGEGKEATQAHTQCQHVSSHLPATTVTSHTCMHPLLLRPHSTFDVPVEQMQLRVRAQPEARERLEERSDQVRRDNTGCADNTG